MVAERKTDLQHSLWRSGPFRFALMLVVIFAIGAASLLAVLSLAADRYARELAGDSIQTEMSILIGEDLSLGRARMIETVRLHSDSMADKQMRYLIIDAAGARKIGDLPQRAARVGTRIDHYPEDQVVDADEQGAGDVRFLVVGTRLHDGALLVLAYDLYDIDGFAADLRQATALFGVVICAIALFGSVMVTRTFLGRLDRVNDAIARIIDGRLNERLPAIGFGVEFDRLTANLNGMLERIEALVDSVRQVSTDIAHDLRTPLARLRQRLEAIQSGELAPEQLEERIEGAIRQADEIIAIFATLLRIGSLEGQGITQAFQPLQPGALLARIAETYGPVADDMGHELHCSPGPSQCALGDEALLVQAITNLVDNALAHTPPGSTVSLGVRNDGGRISLIVEDNGPGIPEDQRGKVVRRFYRLDSSRYTPGAGLGLAIVDAIARLHGSALRLEDAKPGLRAVIDLSPA